MESADSTDDNHESQEQLTATSPKDEPQLESGMVQSATAMSLDKKVEIIPSEPHASPAFTSKQVKLLKSIETMKSNISTTESQLSTKLHQITQLNCFPAPSPDEQAANQQTIDKAALQHAQTIITKHISLMKRYNEIKDIAMGMLSLIAEKEGKRLAEVMEERGISEKD